MKRPVLNIIILAGFALGIAMFNSCKHPVSAKSYRHISDSLFWSFNTSLKGAPEINSLKRLDSLFSSFPDVSAADKYFYYYLKRTIYFVNPNDPVQVQQAIYYTDSMMNLIINEGLYDKMAKEYVRSLEEKANLLINLKMYQNAIDLIIESRYRNNQLHDMESATENIFSLALISYYQKKIDTAIAYYKEGLSMIPNYNRPTYRFFKKQRALDDLGYMYRLSGQYDSSLKYHLKAEQFTLDNKEVLNAPDGDSLFIYQALVNIDENVTTTYLLMGKPDMARKSVLNAIEYSKHLRNNSEKPLILANAYPTWAAAMFSAGDIKTADSLNQLVDSDYNLLSEGTKLKFLYLKVRIDSAGGDQKKLSNSLARYLNMKDSADNNFIEALKKDPNAISEEIDRKYKIERSNRGIRIQKVRSTTAIGIVILLCVFISVLAVFIRKIRQTLVQLRKTMRLSQIQQKQKEEEQLRFQEIRLLLEHNEDIARQRRNISNDLHDSLSGSLVALRYYIEDLKTRQENEGIAMKLGNIGDEVSSIYNATRQYMHDLNTGQQQFRYKLPEQLKELAGKFSETDHFSIILDFDKDTVRQKLDNNEQDQLYYVINEAVSNTIKYANASVCEIKIFFKNGTCYFSVSDNGRGFDPDIVRNGLGLGSMRSRIEQMGGEIYIEPDTKGTIVKGSFTLCNPR